MAVERKPAPSGVFVNDLNAPLMRERQQAADKAKIEEAKHAQKTEHAPSDPAPGQIPGGLTCLTTEQSDPGQTNNTD